MEQKDEMKIESLIFNYIDEFKHLFFNGKKISFLLDYSKNEILAIMFMYRKKVCNVSEIAQYLESPLNTATGVVNRLEKKEIVKRRRDEKDKRVVKIILTDKGEELCTHERKLIASYITRVNNALTDEEKVEAIEIINKVIKSIKADEKEKTEGKAPIKRIRKIKIE